jgi:hypothetical protein
MTDGLTATLEMKLGQSEAELRKANAEIERLTDKLKIAGLELDKFKGKSEKTAADHYSHMTRATNAADTHTASLSRVGRALTRIGGAGSGDLLQLANVAQILVGPMALVAAGAFAASKGWEHFKEEVERSIEAFRTAGKAVQEMNAATMTDKEKKGSEAIADVKNRQSLLTHFGAGGPEEAKKKAKEIGLTESETGKAMVAFAPALKRLPDDQKGAALDNMLRAAKMRSQTGVAVTDAVNEMVADPLALDMAKHGTPERAAARLAKIPVEKLKQSIEIVSKDSVYQAAQKIASDSVTPEATPEELEAAKQKSELDKWKKKYPKLSVFADVSEKQNKQVFEQKSRLDAINEENDQDEENIRKNAAKYKKEGFSAGNLGRGTKWIAKNAYMYYAEHGFLGMGGARNGIEGADETRETVLKKASQEAIQGVAPADKATVASLIATIERSNEKLYQLHASKLVPQMEKMANNPGDRGEKK